MRSLRVLAWPGMPAPGALAAAAGAVGARVDAEVVASNDLLERRMDGGEPYDLVFPSDYLVERLRDAGRIIALDGDALPLDRLERWAHDAVYDPGCRHSVPFAFGTTGVLHDGRFGAFDSWMDVLGPPEGARVGMLDEVREVVGAALIAAGHTPNTGTAAAVADAEALLRRQQPSVAQYDSDDFVTPVVDGTVFAHHAWSGPAAAAVRRHPGLRYVVPREGAVLWITAAAIPADASDPDLSLAFVRELMDPSRAALTTVEQGYATPNAAARALLPRELQEDAALFPDTGTLARCHVVRDLGPDEQRLQAVWDGIRGVAA